MVFKPGWLGGSSLDNARGGFVSVIVDGWAVFDVIPVPIVCSTGILGLRGVGFGFGVEVSGTVRLRVFSNPFCMVSINFNIVLKFNIWIKKNAQIIFFQFLSDNLDFINADVQ